MDNVNERFTNRVEVSENPMVIATAPGQRPLGDQSIGLGRQGDGGGGGLGMGRGWSRQSLASTCSGRRSG